MADILCNNLQPHCQRTSKTKISQLTTSCGFVGSEYIYVDFIDKLKHILAVSIIFIIYVIEQGITFLIQILFRNESVSV